MLDLGTFLAIIATICAVHTSLISGGWAHTGETDSRSWTHSSLIDECWAHRKYYQLWATLSVTFYPATPKGSCATADRQNIFCRSCTSVFHQLAPTLIQLPPYSEAFTSIFHTPFHYNYHILQTMHSATVTLFSQRRQPSVPLRTAFVRPILRQTTLPVQPPSNPNIHDSVGERVMDNLRYTVVVTVREVLVAGVVEHMYC